MGNPNTFRLNCCWRRLLSGLVLLALAGCAARPSNPTPAAAAATAAPSVPASAAQAIPSPAQQDDTLKKFAEVAPTPFEGEGWKPFFDGTTLNGWKETPFSGHGEVEVRDGLILAKMGDPFTGINWTNDFPKMNYEIAL